MRTGGVSHPRSTSTNQCGEGNDAPVTRVKVRLIPGSYSPTIESISAANRAFADRGSAALSRSVDLARRRLRGYCRARLDCRGGSPSGSRPSADLGQAIGRNASASGEGGTSREAPALLRWPHASATCRRAATPANPPASRGGPPWPDAPDSAGLVWKSSSAAAV
jgi:hypothetical protein